MNCFGSGVWGRQCPVVTKEYDKESGEDGERERGKRDFPSYPSVRSLCAKINKWNKGDATIFPLGPNALVHPTFLSPYPGYFLTTSPETFPARPLPFKIRRSC